MKGTLVLMPNTLDFRIAAEAGAVPNDLRGVLPDAVIARAAALRHWVVENAKTTRAFLKRVDQLVPLAVPLQELDIVELPRTPRGRPTASPGSTVDPGRGPTTPAPARDPWAALLQPALLGADVGLHCEAGLPAIADPGASLVAAAHALGVDVLPLTGPSSLMMALAASGLNGQRFAFVGYVPVRPDERVVRLRQLEARSRESSETQLLIETPYRNTALLASLLTTLRGDTRLCVAAGLTTAQGWVVSDRVAAWDAPRRSRVSDDVPAVFCVLAAR